MTPSLSISGDLMAQLDRIAEVGNLLEEEGNYHSAIDSYRCGFELIPSPKELYPASFWFAAAIGDAQWLTQQYQESLDTWRDAIILYGGFGVPFAHLRRGQVLYELGRRQEAGSELLRALLLGGEGIFAEEPEEHWEFITSIANAPAQYPNWRSWPGLDPESDEYRKWTDPADVYFFTQKSPHNEPNQAEHAER